VLSERLHLDPLILDTLFLFLDIDTGGLVSTRAINMIAEFGNGMTIHQICRKFGVSETSYYMLVKPYPELRKIAKEKVIKRKKLEKQKIEMAKKVTKVDIPKKEKRRTDKERIKHLEDRLKRERKKNLDLEKLLKLAKENLGKF